MPVTDQKDISLAADGAVTDLMGKDAAGHIFWMPKGELANAAAMAAALAGKQPIGGATVAAGSLTDIGTAAGSEITVTGNGDIFSFGSAKIGTLKLVTFSGTPVMKHNPAAIVLVNDADIAVADGDRAAFVATSNDVTTVWKLTGYLRKSGKALVPPTKAEVGLVETGINLHNPAGIVENRTVYSDGRIISSSVTRLSAPVPVVAGETYTISGIGPQSTRVGAFQTDSADVGTQGVVLGTIPSGSTSARWTSFTIPDGYSFLRFDITKTAADDDSFDVSTAVALGDQTTDYPYREQIKFDLLTEYFKDWAIKDDLFYAASENLFDPAACDFTYRYSTGSKTFLVDTLGIAASGFMPVFEGETYTISGPGLWPIISGVLGTPQGGFFSELGDITAVAVANITFNGSGNTRTFTVPNGLGIRYAVLSVSKTGGASEAETLEGDVQVELGDTATEFKAFASSIRLRLDLMPHYLSFNRIVSRLAAIESESAQALSNANQALSQSIANAEGGQYTDQNPIVAPVTLAQVNHIIQVGQSLGVGAAGQPAIHTTGWDSHYLTWAGGPKAVPVAAGGDPSATASFVTLIEDNNSPDAGTNRGETGLWSAGHALAQAVVSETGSYGGKGKFLFSAPGHGGMSIRYFAKSTDPSSWWQTMFLPSIRAAKAIADAAGETYAVPVIFWVQGEANLASTGYAGSLSQLFDDMASAVRTETGQTFDPHFVSYITAYATLEGNEFTATRGGTLGQVELIRSRDDVHLGPCVYALPHAPDEIHLINEGYATMGAVFGQALADIIVRNTEPRRLAFKHAYAGTEKSTVEIVFDVTGGRLTLDGDNIAKADDWGFKVVDDSGAPEITSVVAGQDRVTLSLGRALGTNPIVRYAVDYHPVGSLAGTSAASGNLRLSGAFDVSDVDEMAYLWSPPFIEAVQMPS